MKRVVGLVLGVALLGGAGFWFNSWAWNTCQPLDRLFNQSGCTGSIEIADFSPLFRITMAVNGEDGIASLLGWAIDEEGTQAVPTLIRLEPTTGRETARVTLDATSSIVSAIDGTQLELVERSDLFPRNLSRRSATPCGASPRLPCWPPTALWWSTRMIAGTL